MINKFRTLLKMFTFEMSIGAIVMVITTLSLPAVATKEISFLAAMPLFVSFGLLIEANVQRKSASKLNKSITFLPFSLNTQFLYRFMLKIVTLGLYWSIYFFILVFVVPLYNKEIFELMPIVILSTKISFLFILMFDIAEDLEKMLIRKRTFYKATIIYSSYLIYIIAFLSIYFFISSELLGQDSFEMLSTPFDLLYLSYLCFVIFIDYNLFIRRLEY